MASLLNGATRIFNQKTLIILYLVGTIAFGYSGYRLQHKAFTQPPSSGQVFVAIFVQHPNARLDLIAHINPNQPSQDQLAVRIRSGNPGQWLVIIQCPSNPHSSFPQNNATLTSAAAPPTQIESLQNVIEKYGSPSSSGTSRFALGCFQQAAPGTYTIANVTMPALGTDQAIADVRIFPSLYADQHVIVQIFPGAQCPVPEPSPAPTSSTTSGSPSVTPSASLSVAASTPATAASGSTPSGAANAPPPSVVSPDCFDKPPAGTSFSEYYIPKALGTEETLSQIDWKGFTYETEFPNPIDQSSDDIMWRGSSGLSPSIAVANPANDRTVGQDAFISGILFGIAGGTAVSFIDHLVQVNEKRRARKRNSNGALDRDRQEIIILEPAADDGSHNLRFVGSEGNGHGQLSTRQVPSIRSVPARLRGSRSTERRRNQMENTRRLIKRWRADR